MKRIVKILPIFLIIIIMTTLLFAFSNKSFARSLNFKDLNTYKGKYGFCANDLTSYNNVYCLQYGAYINDTQYSYSLQYKIELDGDIAIIEDASGNQRTTDLFANNVMGAILCEESYLGNTSRFYTGVLGYGGTGDGAKTQSQYALWMYWNSWKASNNLSIDGSKDILGALDKHTVNDVWYLGYYLGGIEGAYERGSNYLNTIVSKYAEKAQEKTYNATLYIFQRR